MTRLAWDGGLFSFFKEPIKQKQKKKLTEKREILQIEKKNGNGCFYGACLQSKYQQAFRR